MLPAVQRRSAAGTRSPGVATTSAEAQQMYRDFTEKSPEELKKITQQTMTVDKWAQGTGVTPIRRLLKFGGWPNRVQSADESKNNMVMRAYDRMTGIPDRSAALAISGPERSRMTGGQQMGREAADQTRMPHWDRVIAEKEKRWETTRPYAESQGAMRRKFVSDAARERRELLDAFPGTDEEKMAQLEQHYMKEKKKEYWQEKRYWLARFFIRMIIAWWFMLIPGFAFYQCTFMRAMDKEVSAY